ncbi:hypothetical protein LTR84_001323 [Exophiala bonariae]|uniref:JmjC domain-containing protein n=1 Tax=Exophiala bonariae TaxID=1690606 RepID=A0AAV9NET1_9EURO|nr:hypothetical protein LTR84_001323 [Exophiala bonariae]
MQCIPPRPLSCLQALRCQNFGIRHFNSITSTGALSLNQVPVLPSWDPEPFHVLAYIPALPYQFPRSASDLPSACSRWFTHQSWVPSDGKVNPDHAIWEITKSSELNPSFWTKYQDTLVPLELTSTSDDISESSEEETFERVEEAPLEILLTYLSPKSNQPTVPPGHQRSQRNHSIYLAQCSLAALPPALQQDLPTPSLITHKSSSSPIKGDIYASSLWLGRPPTYTPLHRDPNPNIFIQLAGQKVVRLLPPEIGAAVFADVQARLNHRQDTSANIRGDEMMIGPEKAVLHNAIWPIKDGASPYEDFMTTYGQETTLGMGDALFIPKGWWHSVKGVGTGVTASVNWWFR